MNFKKRVNGSWHNISHYVHKTSTDTITTLPADIYPNAATATVGLKGNTVQFGTPTPDNPIQPQGTGERTGTLSDTLMGGISTSDGSDASYNPTQSQIRSQYIPCTEGTNYIVSANKYPVQNFVTFYDANKNYLSRTSGIPLTQARIFTTPANAAYMRATFVHATDEQLYPYSDGVRIMLNAGSTALPYEPYGYKIPISSASTTTPVYLGEVETTRKIRKWVLKGDEDGWFYSSNFVYNENITPDYLRSSAQTVLCSHFKAIPNVTAGGNVGDGECALYSISGVQRLYFRDSNYTTSAANFKAYLAQQYAAGTPVTIWYVLATATTGIVNEPIRKIGDYADEVSGITIPTIAGANTLSVDTALQPSEVSVNYKGWHPVADVHERENGAWT